jgi:enoyl-CoA hydratase/carnithine racemase
MYQNLPPGIALELLFIGERISARRFYEIGFLNRIVQPEELMDAALGMAQKIRENGPLAVKMDKEIFYRSRDMNRKDIESLNWKLQNRILKSKDNAEGLKAYIEKRKPVYRGI